MFTQRVWSDMSAMEETTVYTQCFHFCNKHILICSSLFSGVVGKNFFSFLCTVCPSVCFIVLLRGLKEEHFNLNALLKLNCWDTNAIMYMLLHPKDVGKTWRDWCCKHYGNLTRCSLAQLDKMLRRHQVNVKSCTS